MKYTNKQLKAFIERANTIEKIEIARDWFENHVPEKQLFNLLIMLEEQEMMINSQDVSDPTGYTIVPIQLDPVDLEIIRR